MIESVAKFPCGEVTVAKLPCGEVTGNQRDSVENKLASLPVVPLGKALSQLAEFKTHLKSLFF